MHVYCGCYRFCASKMCMVIVVAVGLVQLKMYGYCGCYRLIAARTCIVIVIATS